MEIYAGKNGSALLMMLPEEFSSKVKEWGQGNISPDKLSGLPNKGYDKSPHITLATGIIDQEPEKAFELLNKKGPFNVRLGEVECFRKPEKGYDVIKIAVDSDDLKQLNEALLETVEVNNSINPFTPHITLAYVKPFSCDNLLGHSEFKGMEVPIEGYVYSDREKGGRIVKLKKGEPLKESLDYSLAEVAQFLDKKGLFIKSMSSREIAKTIIAMNVSNKTV
jgi:2'-5' RNA ligase